MTKSQATEIMKHLIKAQKALDSAVLVADEIQDENERLKYRKQLLSSMSDNSAFIMIPIVKQYPELNPYNDDNEK